jgi:hypothetical protein
MNSNATGVLTDACIERVVIELRQLDHRSAWERVLEVGRVVFEGIAQGDRTMWHSRRGQKNISLRKLVQHPRCPFKKTALSNAVGVHLFTKSHPEVRQLASLGPTHVAQVLGMDDADALTLLTRADRGKSSVRDLARNVRLLRREAGERRGRPPAPVGRKAVTLGRRAEAVLRQMRDELSTCDAADDECQRAVRAVLEGVSKVLSDLSKLPAVTGRRSLVLAHTRPLSMVDEPGAAVG